MQHGSALMNPKKAVPKPVDALSRSQGHVELVVNYRTAGSLLNQMNDWWEDLFSPDHDRFPGDWYARPQALIPARKKQKVVLSGSSRLVYLILAILMTT